MSGNGIELTTFVAIVDYEGSTHVNHVACRTADLNKVPDLADYNREKAVQGLYHRVPFRYVDSHVEVTVRTEWISYDRG